MDEKQKANVPSMVINDPFPGSASYSKDSEEVSEVGGDRRWLIKGKSKWLMRVK